MKIFISGSESTGKSQLSEGLAKHFSARWVREYAREYVQKLQGSYSYSDVEEIARMQFEQINNARPDELVFFDTGLVITKVWFEVKFKRVPDWFMVNYPEQAKGSYLLCNPDIPWENDPVRENPHIRTDLDKIYAREIESLNQPMERISGLGEERLKNAINIVNYWIKTHNNGNREAASDN